MRSRAEEVFDLPPDAPGTVAGAAVDEVEEPGGARTHLACRPAPAFGALGPAGLSLYDLMDASTLSQMLGAGDCGASIILCRGEHCSLSSASPQMPLDLEKAIPFVRNIVC